MLLPVRSSPLRPVPTVLPWLALALAIAVAPLLMSVAQAEPYLPRGRSVQSYGQQWSGQAQHIVHVPDSPYGQAQNGHGGNLVISKFGDSNNGGHSGFGPVITISGFGGTITISPGHPATSYSTSTNTRTDPGAISYSGESGSNTQSDFGSTPEFVTSSGFEAEPHANSGFVDGSNNNGGFVTGSDFSSGFVDSSTSSFTTGSDQNPDITYSQDTFSGPDQGSFVNEPESSFTTFISSDSPSVSIPETFDTNSGTTYSDGRGTDLSSNIGNSQSSSQYSAGSSGSGSGRGADTGTDPEASAKLPKTSGYGPNFGRLPGHSRRKTCTTVVDLEAEFDLRLIPYNIPVVGPEVPSTGCPRDEIRFGTLDGPCIRALEQGTCGENQWILFNNITNVGSCAERRCPVGTAFVEATGFCHDQFQADFCPGDRLIQVTASGESVCGCDDGWFPDRCGVCQLIFSHEGCPSGLAHQFNTEFEFRCLPTPCPRNRPLQLPGGRGCSFFGAPCERQEDGVTLPGLWGFLMDSLTVSCISDEATVSRRRRRRDVNVTSLEDEVTSLEDALEELEDRTPGHGRARFRRAVFGGTAPVNSCQPGARTDFNTACRSAAVPARSRRATSDSAPSCPRGTSMVNGKCSGGGDDLGK